MPKKKGKKKGGSSSKSSSSSSKGADKREGAASVVEALGNYVKEKYGGDPQEIVSLNAAAFIDDSLSPTELSTILTNMKIKATSKDVNFIIKLWDKTGKGSLTTNEFKEGMLSIMSDSYGFPEGCIIPTKGTMSDEFLLQLLLRVQEEASEILSGFTKNEMRILMQHSSGLIQYDPGDVIVPPNAENQFAYEKEWVGINLQGCDVHMYSTEDAMRRAEELKSFVDQSYAKERGIPVAILRPGCFVRALNLLEKMHMTYHKVSEAVEEKHLQDVEEDVVTDPVGVRRGYLDRKMWPGSEAEYLVASKTGKKGTLIVWTIQDIKQMLSSATNFSLGQRLVEKICIAAFSDFKERRKAEHAIEASRAPRAAAPPQPPATRTPTPPLSKQR